MERVCMPFYFLFFLLIISSFTARALTPYASIGDLKACPNANYAVPVLAGNLVNIDTLVLTLQFNPDVVTFKKYQNPNPLLTGGVLKVDQLTSSVRITWYRSTPLTLANDVLIELVFLTNKGTTSLHWTTEDPGSCYFHIYNGANAPASFTDGSLKIFSPIKLNLTQIDQTCIGQCNADYLATVTRGTRPYSYLWNNHAARFDSIETHLCDGLNEILVTDSNNCKLDSLFWISGLPSANVTISISPDSVIYLQNPTLQFDFQSHSTVPIVEWVWRFGDGDTSRAVNPTHTYQDAIKNQSLFYELQLYVKNQLGCDTTIKVKLQIKDADLVIPNVMTPNNDGANDVFKIINKSNTSYSNDGGAVKWEFLKMELYIFDRWGRRLLADTNYQNNWKAEGLSDGVYFFELITVGYYRTSKYKGSITLLGSGLK